MRNYLRRTSSWVREFIQFETSWDTIKHFRDVSQQVLMTGLMFLVASGWIMVASGSISIKLVHSAVLLGTKDCRVLKDQSEIRVGVSHIQAGGLTLRLRFSHLGLEGLTLRLWVVQSDCGSYTQAGGLIYRLGVSYSEWDSHTQAGGLILRLVVTHSGCVVSHSGWGISYAGCEVSPSDCVVSHLGCGILNSGYDFSHSGWGFLHSGCGVSHSVRGGLTVILLGLILRVGSHWKG